MGTIDEGLEAQIRNIEERYGKPLSEWIAIVRESGITKHTDMVAMLKSQYGMSRAFSASCCAESARGGWGKYGPGCKGFRPRSSRGDVQ